MTTQLSPTPIFKGFANDGTPLAYGLLYSYAAGTTTPQATYIDSTQTTPNTNPIVLNARGECALWLVPSLSYKLNLTDRQGNEISGYPVDNIIIGTPLPIDSLNVHYDITPQETLSGSTPVNYNYLPGNVLRYSTNTTPGVTDMTAAAQASANQCGQAGGSPVFFPAGTYLINSTVLIASCTQSIRLLGEGVNLTTITKTTDSDLFGFTNIAGSQASFIVSDMTISAKSTMTSGAALRFEDDGVIPSVFVHDVLIINSLTSTFRYGVRLKNCIETRFNNVIQYGIDSTSLIAWQLEQTANSSVNKFFGCSVYNAGIGCNIVNGSNPGIEGTQFYGCDFAFVSQGVVAVNTAVGYSPPGITWIGGHINASVNNFVITGFSQPVIQGALLYNTGTTGAVVALSTTSDVNIIGNTIEIVSGGNCDVITMSATSVINGGLIANNLARMGIGHSFLNLNVTNLVNLNVIGNQRTAGGATITNSAGTIPGSVQFSGNTPDPVDIFDTTITPTAGANSLVGTRAEYFLLGTPGSPVTVTSLTSRNANDECYLLSTSTNITIQHNATNPDGFSLQAATNFTFGATAGIGKLHLKKLNGGYWTEVGRD